MLSSDQRAFPPTVQLGVNSPSFLGAMLAVWAEFSNHEFSEEALRGSGMENSKTIYSILFFGLRLTLLSHECSRIHEPALFEPEDGGWIVSYFEPRLFA